MKAILRLFLPLLLGFTVAFVLHVTVRWWGFWIIFPWIGFSISTGMFIRFLLKGRSRLVGRKIAILMVLPCLLLFIPIFNNENFQLEGVLLIVMAGFFGKGFIHYAIAKIFGPLIWGRGFCGWACWTGAILDWLPIKRKSKERKLPTMKLRFVMLTISFLIPLFLIFVLNYDVRTNYINQHEMIWMFVGNGIYYLLAIPLAFIHSDKRYFCKHLCPVSLVMMPTSSVSIIKVKPKGGECIECGACNTICPMGINVMEFAKNRMAIKHPDCILCTDCSMVCPVNAI